MKKTLLSSLSILLLLSSQAVVAQLPRPFLITSTCPASNNNPSVLRQLLPGNTLSTVGTINVGGTPIVVNGVGADLADPNVAYAMSAVTSSGPMALMPPTFYRIDLTNASATVIGDITPPPTPAIPPGSPPGSFGVAYAINLAADGLPGSKYYLTGATAIARFVTLTTVQVTNLRMYLGEISLQPVATAVPTWRLVDTSDPATTAIMNAFEASVNSYLNGGPIPQGGFQDLMYVPSTGSLICYLGVDNKFLTVSNIDTSPVAVTTTPTTLLPLAAQSKECGTMYLDGNGDAYVMVSDQGIAYRIDPVTGEYMGSSVTMGFGCTRGDGMRAAPIVTLPVTLTSFSASAEGSKVRLAWRTAQEKGVARFVVERSADGRFWKDVVSVPATNLPEGNRYAVLDEKPEPAARHYRLRTEDLDGEVAYSDARLVTLGARPPELEPYPNPARGTFQVAVSAPLPGEVKLVNALGQLVWRQALPAGHSEAAAPAVRPGVYQLVGSFVDGQHVARRVVVE